MTWSWRRLAWLGVALAWLAAPRAGLAEAVSDAAVLDRVRALEDELALLRRKLEVKEEEDTAKAAASALATADKGGFQIQSPDKTAFKLRLRGYAHVDSRSFLDENDSLATRETFTLRRARLLIEGTLFENVDFRLMPDWGGGSASLQDAYLNLRYWRGAQLQAGKFKAPFGLERLQSATALTFIERGFPTQLAPNRDLGLQFHGDLREGMFQYQLALMNGVVDGASADGDADDEKDIVARVFAQPFQETAWPALQGLGIGFAGSFGEQERLVTSAYRTNGQDPFFRYAANVREQGDRVRWGPQATYYWGPFGAMFEWTRSSTELALGTAEHEADVTAWQVAASWVLTGESAGFRGVAPSSSFKPSAGTWGAFEVAARYHRWQIDDDVFSAGFASAAASASEADAVTVGLSWYLNPFVKVLVNYERTEFDDGGGAAGVDRDAEDLFLTRFQLAY